MSGNVGTNLSLFMEENLPRKSASSTAVTREVDSGGGVVREDVVPGRMATFFTFNLSRLTPLGRPPVLLLPLFLACFLTQVRVPAVALRLISVDVPSPTIVGESVELNCLYDLQEEPLYSVKWYKDDVEFYRYVPNDWPPAQYLPAPGIKIDLTRSNAFTAFLRNVDLNSAGTYRCEVSAEAPSFATEEAEKVLQVLVLPSQGPTILGGRSKYRVGDTVNVNCTSAKSKPAAVLKWYINGLPVKPEYEVDYATTLHDDGLESSSLGLRFSTTRSHFEKGNMKLKCMATVSQIYTMSNEEIVFGGLQQTSGLLQISANDGQAVRSSANSSRSTSQAIPSVSLVVFTLLSVFLVWRRNAPARRRQAL